MIAFSSLFLALLAAPAASQTSSSQPVVHFHSPGPKEVTLRVCDAFNRCSTVRKIVNVLDPAPRQLALTAVPLEVSPGETLVLSAQAVGRPPLSYRFRLWAGASLLATLQGPTATWRVTAPLGTLSLELIVDNSAGSALLRQTLTVRPRPATVFYALPPCRLLDTRTTGQPLTSAAPLRAIPLAGLCGIPEAATAVALNATAIATTQVPLTFGSVSLHPPVTSTLQAPPHRPRAAFSVVPLERRADGSSSGILYASALLPPPHSVHLILDTSGFFLPATSSPASIDQFVLSTCSLGSCIVPAGAPVTFLQAFRSVPPGTVYAYDLDGNGSAELRSTTPQLNHSFPSTGFFTPVLTLELPSGLRVSYSPSPVFVVPPASTVPATPRLTASFAGLATYPGLLQPSIQPTFAVADSANPTVLGYAFYLRLPGSPSATLLYTLPLSHPIPIPQRGVFLSAQAIGFSGASARSVEIFLP